jgi:hypothetical protein
MATKKKQTEPSASESTALAAYRAAERELGERRSAYRGLRRSRRVKSASKTVKAVGVVAALLGAGYLAGKLTAK